MLGLRQVRQWLTCPHRRHPLSQLALPSPWQQRSPLLTLGAHVRRCSLQQLGLWGGTHAAAAQLRCRTVTAGVSTALEPTTVTLGSHKTIYNPLRQSITSHSAYRHELTSLDASARPRWPAAPLAVLGERANRGFHRQSHDVAPLSLPALHRLRPHKRQVRDGLRLGFLFALAAGLAHRPRDRQTVLTNLNIAVCAATWGS